MPLPDLTDHGLLPLGVHLGTLEEVIARFGVDNERREHLGASLRLFVELAQSFGVFVNMFVDGSFTTDRELPGDVDVVLQCPSTKLADLARDARYAQLDRALVKAKYEVDLIVEPSESGNVVMVSFFQTIKTKDIIERRLAAGTRRGIVKVRL